jgi:hypothetical protein
MKDIAISSPVLIILAVLVYGLLHSLLASLGVKSLARRWFGPLVDRFYRLGYNIFASLSLLPILALPALLPDQTLYIVPYPWILMTAAIQGLATLVLLWLAATLQAATRCRAKINHPRAVPLGAPSSIYHQLDSYLVDAHNDSQPAGPDRWLKPVPGNRSTRRGA